MTIIPTRLLQVGAVAVAAGLALTACAQSDPLTSPTGSGSAAGDTIVIGSQAYYSNEIIAEIYAQALEADGKTVERRFNIGQRDAYWPSLESGEITVFPEYTGNLLQYLDAETTARTPDEVTTGLAAALPSGLTALTPAPATDQDSYNVTAEFAQQHGLTSIEDLAKVDGLVLGGPPELAERPYGPTGLESVYGVKVDFQGTGDTTVDELVEGRVQVANVYSADPRIQTDKLVTLTDPKNLFLASNVVPIVNASVADSVKPTLDAVDAKLTPEALIALNVQSTVDQKSSADIAKAWLTENGFVS